MPEKLYTAAQIGELMGGKSARAVRQMITKGCFGETVQDGRRHLVTESGYNAYIQSHTGPPAPYQRHFSSGRPRRNLPEPQPLKV